MPNPGHVGCMCTEHVPGNSSAQHSALTHIVLTPCSQLAQREEAQRLAQTSFGVPLLTTIARCYRSAADAYLGGLVGGTWARVKAGTDLVR